MMQVVKRALQVVGLTPTRSADDGRLRDIPPQIRKTIDKCRPYTMTSPERLFALCGAIEYLVANDVPGDFVECGVWKGGSSMAAALTYLRCGRSEVDLHLFDTFEGMSEPSDWDVHAGTGITAKVLLGAAEKEDAVWACSSIEEVDSNLASTGYPKERIHLVQGKVEDTIPDKAPASVALLRLDTDWYESTKHEMEHLFPRISHGGVLIVDDYGHWAGARKAIDEYIEENGLRILLSRIDYTGRIAVKC